MQLQPGLVRVVFHLAGVSQIALPLPLPSPPLLCSQVFTGIGGPSLLEGRGLQEWQKCIPDILNETYDGGDVPIDIFEQVGLTSSNRLCTMGLMCHLGLQLP